MRRRTTAGALGLVAVAAAVVVLVATSVGGQAASPSGRPIAQASDPATTPTSTPAVSPAATPLATPTPTTAVPTPATVPAPLTGRPVAPEIASRHPIAVMIDDLGPARPQSGLASASVVWQAPAEGGVARYMAVYQDEMPQQVGPVRSARYYYIAWAAEWRALYVHSGGSPQALETLRANGNGRLVYNGDEFRYSGTFIRRTTRRPPHNLYTTGAKLRSLAQRLGAKDQPYGAVWRFAPDAPLDSRPYGGTISTTYPDNTIRYTYDRTTNTYLRSVTGETNETDAADGTRIAPTNVVVMRMSFGPLNDGHPAKMRLEATVVGSGTAWISTNGRTITGRWKKASLTKPTQFFDTAGNEVTLTIGQTFVQVVADGYPVAFTAGSDRPPTSAAPSGSPASH